MVAPEPGEIDGGTGGHGSGSRGPSRRYALPLLTGLAGYRPDWLRQDLAAGLAIAAVGLPTAIAYPAIAGLPPETGLYASMAPLIGYAVFGPSRRLIVGPDAATVTVLAGVMATVFASMPTLAPEHRVAAASAIAIGVGLICLVARLLNFGAIASFLSRPILVGFFAGISLSILVGQIKRLTGVEIESDGLIQPFVELFAKAGSIHWPTLILGAAMFALLQGTRLLRLPVPGPVVVVVVAIALSAIFDFEARGIAVVGPLPTTLPSLGLPDITALPIRELVLGSAVVFLVSFGSGIITARSFGARNHESVDPNAELVGFAAANIGAGLVGGFPVTSSDSRTAVNLSVGGRTQLAGIAAAVALAVAVVFFGNLLSILPLPALGAILVGAALGLIDLDSLRQIWRISRIEFLFAMIAMAGAIDFGVLQGVVIAIAATLVYVLYKGMHPRVVMLGRIPGQDGFYKLHRSASVQPVPGLAISLIEGNVLFYSSDHVKADLSAQAAALTPGTRWFIIDAAGVAQVDSTAAGVLEDFGSELAARGIRLGIAELHFEAHALLERAGVIAAIGPYMIFEDLEDALRAFNALRQDGGNGAGPDPSSIPTKK